MSDLNLDEMILNKALRESTEPLAIARAVGLYFDVPETRALQEANQFINIVKDLGK